MRKTYAIMLFAASATLSLNPAPVLAGDDEDAKYEAAKPSKKEADDAEARADKTDKEEKKAAKAAANAETDEKGRPQKGRRFFLRSTVFGYRVAGPTDWTKGPEMDLVQACAAAGTQLVATKVPVTVKTIEQGKSDTDTFQEYYVQTDADHPSALAEITLLDGWFSSIKKDANCLETDLRYVKQGERFVARPSDINRGQPTEVGPVWGLLVVPFKYQLSGTQRIEGGAAAGAYLGFEWGDGLFDTTFAPIVFFGASNIEVTQLVDGAETKQSLFAISYGGGLKYSLSDAFDIGVVVGFDHTNDESHYQYNDKPWVAMQFGVKLNSMFNK